MRKLDMEDADELQIWLWRPEVYTYWGTPLGKGKHENDRIGNVGYRISPDVWNQGICTEAMRRVADFIFADTAIKRLQAEADVENAGSNAVLRKAGFMQEGCIRQGRMGSRYCSYNIYGLLKADRE